MHPQLPAQRDLLLVGGGHSHVSVIKQFGMRPLPGVRVSLLCEDTLAPYSGMLPGWIAGHYGEADCFIDLRRLCQWAGCRLLQGRAVRLDPEARLVYCDDRPATRYDWLALNVGSTPQLSAIAGASASGVPVKPIRPFQHALEQWLAGVDALPAAPVLAIVGGGAASVELALAVRHRLGRRRARIVLLSASVAVLPTHNRRVRRYFEQRLAAEGIEFQGGQRVVAAGDGALRCEDGREQAADFIVWALQAGPPRWLESSGLELDEGGFIAVNRQLQSTSHPTVFGAGDCIGLDARPLPKSGVYAVRQGPVLADNLRRSISGRPLRSYRPQRRFLSLLATGDRQAVASRGRLFAAGPWVWRWKDHIDRRFMARFSFADAPPEGSGGAADAAAPQPRCGGCGAKVGGDVLARVLARLPAEGATGSAGFEDAALFEPPPGRQIVQTIDHFRAFIDDPYLFGAIAANHCLGDIYAMGAEPLSALALANVPFSHPRIAEDTLLQLMLGALSTLTTAGTRLLGGHTSEAAELAFGLTVNGAVAPGTALAKGGLQPGQCLILTKRLGTGTLLAAHMRHQCRARWLDQALQHMLMSNAAAAATLRRWGATGCTDVTGFGLLGHLVEMLQASGLAADLELAALPLLDGAEDCLSRGILSTLHPSNLAYAQALAGHCSTLERPRERALFDPQTAGGLLAGIPPRHLDACLRSLQQAGYPAVCIGRTHTGHPAGRVQLR